MKKYALLLAVLSMSALAQTANTNQLQGQRSEKPPISDEMKAAFEACKTSGKPHDTAFDNCMESKGFKKPEGHKNSDRPMGQPPRSMNAK